MIIGIAINKSWNIFNFRQGLIRALQDQGHQIIAIAPRDEYVARLEEMGCVCVHLPVTDTGSNPLVELWAIFKFYLILRKYQVDVLLNYTIKCNLYGSLAASWKRIPVICNISGLGTAFLANSFSSRVARWLSRSILHRANHLFFQNMQDQEEFLYSTGLSKMSHSLLPGSGVDLSKFSATSFSSPNTFQFLVLARLIVEKGIVEFAQAAAIVKDSFPEAKFLIVGGLDVNHARAIDPAALKKWIDNGWVEYLSHRDDIAELINQSEVVVLPSYREGTPRSLLEGAACGRPLITTDVPGCREVVRDGENGYLCEVKSAASLASKCMAYLKLALEKKLAMGKASRRLVEEKFDEDRVIQAYVDKIQEVT